MQPRSRLAIEQIEVIALEFLEHSVIEMVAAKSVSVDTIEVVTVEPTSGTKRKAKAKSKGKVACVALGGQQWNVLVAHAR